MPINYTHADGQLRLLIADTDETNPVLDDQQVEGFLALYGLGADDTAAARGPLKRAAADALDAIATSEALVSKVIRTQDLATDGPKVAASLRAHATTLRAQADVDDEQDGAFFEVIEFSPYPSPVL